MEWKGGDEAERGRGGRRREETEKNIREEEEI